MFMTPQPLPQLQSLSMFKPDIHKPIERVDIALSEGRSYPIWIGPQLWSSPETWRALPKARLALIVSNTVVAPLYAQHLMDVLKAHYERVELLVLPDGESHKTWHTLNSIFDHLLGAGADRKTVLFAAWWGTSRVLLRRVSCGACPLCKCPPPCWLKWTPLWAAKPR